MVTGNHLTVISDYLMDPERYENKFRMMTDGLSAVKNLVLNWNESTAWVNIARHTDPLMKHMLSHAYLLRCIERCNTYKECKGIILWFMEKLRNMPNSAWTASFQAYLAHMMSNIRETQKAEHALEESVICACSPIVPYQGILKKPFTGIEIDENAMNEELKKSMESWHDRALAMCWYDSLSNMYEMATDHACIDTLLINAELVDVSKLKVTDVGTMREIAATLFDNPKFEKLRPVIAYILWAYVYMFAQELDKAGSEKLVYTALDLTKLSFRELFDTHYHEATQATEAELHAELETYETLNKFVKDPETITEQNSSTDPLELFDLTKLMNFIYTNRRFRANKYTNMAFMNSPVIGGYIFYKEFLIIEPNTVEGNDMNFLYVPVIDDLNGSQVVVIKYWRNGEIRVLTETEYAAETEPAHD